MAWYNKIFGGNKEDYEEKLNPAQPYYDHKVEPSREPTFNYERAYEEIEIVNRAVNMIVDDAAEIPTRVGDPHKGRKRSKRILKEVELIFF
jgi:hypothetical protein